MYEAKTLVDRGPNGHITFPEGGRWHGGRFWFSDLYTEAVYSCEEDGSDVQVEASVAGTPVGLGWLPDGRLLILAIDDRQLLRRDHDGSLVVHADFRPHLVSPGDGPNDMFVAEDGSAYVGMIGFNPRAGEPFNPGPVLRVTADGSVSVVSEPLYFPNGMALIDGRTLVVAESWGNRLSAFDVDAGGSLSTRRDWATLGDIPDMSDQTKVFDQLVVACDGISGPDAEGAVWVADYLRPRAVRVLPGVGIVDEVKTSGGLNSYDATLGGADGRTLFLATTAADTDPALRRSEPAGQIQVARVDVPAAVFAHGKDREESPAHEGSIA
ncbi:SMP-30/gluconolactonase/LRE family protein [Arthrobacter sp. M4]|uniref:SMP-30/gluconolactonase/LRE family protein n=1 Tax=Arthrobacter sp. M4 TaxID=218160 RepID=UPI001CDC6B27|nr:SMP-30/gluconolactonase/LRE family protein [Arthrobacter sp. M4]MCA4135381.1 SMP-30/gluconolactonase/LRE family protein [Arthrobacter sp. M4]